MLAKQSRKRRARRLILTAVVHKDGKWYVAECPGVGTVSQGRTLDKAVENLKESTHFPLARRRVLGETNSRDRTCRF